MAAEDMTMTYYTTPRGYWCATGQVVLTGANYPRILLAGLFDALPAGTNAIVVKGMAATIYDAAAVDSIYMQFFITGCLVGILHCPAAAGTWAGETFAPLEIFDERSSEPDYVLMTSQQIGAVANDVVQVGLWGTHIMEDERVPPPLDINLKQVRGWPRV